MRYTTAVYVMALALVTGLSAWMDYHFGAMVGDAIGHGPQIGTLFASLSVILLLVGFLRKDARERGDKGRADLAWGVTIVLALLGVVGSLGVLGMGRYAATGQVSNEIATVENLDNEIDRLRKQVEAVTSIPRQGDVIEAARQAMLQTVVAGKTVEERVGDCTAPDEGSPQTFRKYCPQLAALKTEAALATQYWSDAQKLSDLTSQRAGKTKPASANPQAAVLAQLMGGSEEFWQAALVAFMSLVIVGVGVVGPELIPSGSHPAIPQAKTEVKAPAETKPEVVAPAKVEAPEAEEVEEETAVAAPAREKIRVIYRTKKVPVIRYRVPKKVAKKTRKPKKRKIAKAKATVEAPRHAVAARRLGLVPVPDND